METEVGTISIFEGDRYKKIKPGPDSDRNTWQKIPTVTPSEASWSSVMNSMALGLGDELLGSLRGAVDPDMSMGEGMQRARVPLDAARNQHPGASMAGEIGGAIVPGLVTGGLAAGPLAARTGMRAAGSIGAAGAAGAAEGALYGFGNAEGSPRERAPYSAFGMLGGAAGGAGGAAAARGIGRMGEKLFTPLAERELPGFVAARQMADEMEGLDGMTVDDITRRAAGIGPGTITADVSPAFGRLTRAARNASKMVEEDDPFRRVVGRARSRGENLASAVRDAFGIRGSRAGAEDAAEEGLERIREVYYRPMEESYSRIDDPAVLAALEHPDVRPYAGSIVDPDDLRVGRDKAPSFTQLQGLRQELRERMSSPNPDDRIKARAALERLNGPLREAIPELGEADNLYENISRQLRAYAEGRRLWNADASPEDLMRALNNADSGEAFAIRSSILDAVENQLQQRGTGGATAGLLENAGPAPLQKLQALVESDEAFEELLGRFTTSGTHQRTWRALSGNSSTALQELDAKRLFGGIPTDQRGLVQSLLGAFGAELSDAEWGQAARILANTLLSEGEETATLLAMQMSQAAGRSGMVGGAMGALGGMAGAELGDDNYTFDVGR